MNLKEVYSKNTDPKLSRDEIRKLKEDVISFKKKHPSYKFKKWIKYDERVTFVLDYMKARDLKMDYTVYEQATYIVMSQRWEMHPIVKARD